MKLFKFRRFQQLVVICLLVFCTQFSYGQNTKRIAQQAEATISALDFQKKYVKLLKSEYKLNKDLYNILEKEAKKNPAFKNDRSVKSRLKKSKDALSTVKKRITQWEDTLSSIGDDAQLANIELQNQLQKQQQTLQTMSNVSKMLHDTAMSIIRKIG